MANPNGRKGTQFENDIVEHLRSHNFIAERLPRNGAKDQGDGYETDGTKFTLWEAKNEKRIDLPRYLKELEVERQNFSDARRLEPWQVRGIVIVKRRMAKIGECYVVTTVDNYFGIDLQ